MDSFLDWIYGLSPFEATFWLLMENIALFVLSVALGYLVELIFARRPVVPPPEPVDGREIVLATSTVLLNAFVTVAGWFLWKRGIIVIRRDTGWEAWVDVLLLLLIMDVTMYLLHRVVHLPWFYAIHHLHHAYDRPRPLDLYVLHPLENLSFGLLWLIVVATHSWSFLGISVYLTINLVSGTLGHLGVEPFPAWFDRVPLLRQVGTSTFHAQHHQDIHHNYGFYTLIWDRLFGTLVPSYDDRFGRVPEGGPPQATGRDQGTVGLGIGKSGK